MTTEVKPHQLQKQIEELKRKLRDANHDKIQALSRCNEDWESKLSAQTNLALKRLEVEHQKELEGLRSELQVQMGRSVAEVLGERDGEMKRLRDTLGQAKESAVKQAIFLSEEKHIEIMKQREEEWKTRERALTREIFHLSGERQQINNQLAVLRESDNEKAAVIKRLNFDHEQAVKEMIDVSKQDQSKEYSRFKAIERCAQDREFEIRRLEGKVEVLRVDKELLEKQLLTLKKLYSPDSSPTVARVMRFTDREREQSKKIRDLEDKLRNIQRDKGTATPIGGRSPPDIHSPTVPDSEEKLASIKRQRKELREKVKKLEEKCFNLEQRNINLECETRFESEYKQREDQLKQKYNNEIELLENEAQELREKIHSLSISDNTNQELEEMALVVERCENRYKKLYFEHLMSQQMTLLWSEDRQDQKEDLESVRMELEGKVIELGEMRDLNGSYKIRVDCLRDEYITVQEQNDKLIEEKDRSESARNRLEEELEAVNETVNEFTHQISEKTLDIETLSQTNERLKSQHEVFSQLMDKQIQEIDSLKTQEMEYKLQKQHFSALKERSEGKERDFLAIIQTLEDRNSVLQHELQSKEDELASKAKRKSRDDKNYGRAEVLFYPQSVKFNNNHHNNNDSSEDESEGSRDGMSGSSPSEEVLIYPSESNDGIEKVTNTPATELAPISVDQLSNSSSSTSEELPPVHLLSGSRIEDSNSEAGNSIDEWSHTSDENIGATPSSPNLSPIPTPKRTTAKQPPEVYLIRYNYDPLLSSPNPHPEQELTLSAGEYVYIYGTKDDDGFYLGELPGGKHGLVPSNFVEKIKVKSLSSENKSEENPIEPLGHSKGPLDLYLNAQSGADKNSSQFNYNSNLSNISEEDESLLDESNLTKVSGNVSSTESIKLQISNESLDKICEIESIMPATPGHIPTPTEVRVNYTSADVEIHWTAPSSIEVTGYNITIGDDTVYYIDGSKNSVLLSSLDSNLSPSIHTLTISTDSPLGASGGVNFTVDKSMVPPPYGLYFSEEDNGVKVGWLAPGTKSLSSPLISFQVHLNGDLIRIVDYSDFLINKGVMISEADLLKSDTKTLISVCSVLSDGRRSELSGALEVPSRLSTSSEATPVRMISLDSDSTEEGSRRSSSSESEVLEVFRKSSLETDQLLKKIQATSLIETTEVVSKPPIDPRSVPLSLMAGQRQSFTPNEDDLFTELEAQGASYISPSPLFSLEDPQTQSDSDDDSPHYTEIHTLDVTVTYYVALYDYNPEAQPNSGDDQTELKLRKGDVVAIYGEMDSEGFFQAQLDDNVGLVPYNLVEKIDLSNVSGETSSALLFQANKQAFPAKKFTAIYSYNPRVDSPNSEDMDDELSFESGASISIYGDVQEDGFFIGEQNGEMGFVPSNFVEPSDHIKPAQSPQPLDTSNGLKGATSLEPPKANKTILAKTKGIFKSLSKKS